MVEAADISFVNLGFSIKHLQNSITVLGFPIAYYGIIIGMGMLAGLWIAQKDARRRGQDPEIYMDFAIYAIVFSIIGARIYYVVFAWDDYKNRILQIFNLRGGGLAIYGGVIGAALTLLIFTKIRKFSFLSMADTGVLGLVTGQIIGRWGNFFNCEAFGGYTNNIFAMRIRKTLVDPGMISKELMNHQIIIDGVEYVQVHPTFLYESLWNIALLCFLLWYRKHKKYDGELLWIYLMGYGLGRMWIEGLRTDQLIFFNTGIPVSQALSFLLAIVSAVLLLRHNKTRRADKRKEV